MLLYLNVSSRGGGAPLKISVCVVSHNARESLKLGVTRLLRHTAPEVPIFIYDNASTDGTRECIKALARRHPRLKARLFPNNLGRSGACNQHIRDIQSDWTVLMDDDCFVDSGWLQGLLAAAKAHPCVGIAGPRLRCPDGRIFSAEGLLPQISRGGYGEPDKGQRSYSRFCEVVSTACMLVRKDVFSRVGFFDERFFPCQCEDVDFCLRARLKGFKILYHGGTVIVEGNLFRTAGRHAVNLARLKKKWRDFSVFPLADSHSVDGAMIGIERARREGNFLRVLGACRDLKSAEPGPSYTRLCYEAEALAALGKKIQSLRRFRLILADDCAPSYLKAQIELAVARLGSG